MLQIRRVPADRVAFWEANGRPVLKIPQAKDRRFLDTIYGIGDLDLLDDETVEQYVKEFEDMQLYTPRFYQEPDMTDRFWDVEFYPQGDTQPANQRNEQQEVSPRFYQQPDMTNRYWDDEFYPY